MAHRTRVYGPLILITLGAIILRLVHVGFGLPGLYDPDEPLFVIKAYELLDGGTLNPHWFGHPGTVTIYTVALVEIAVALAGFASGSFQTLEQFALSVFNDFSVLFLPARMVFVLFGAAGVFLTGILGRYIYDRWTGLMAAALLALNASHVAWSQVIRTDLQSSFFTLLSAIFAVRFAQQGRTRDLVLAGLVAGLAIATKWPAGVALVAGIGAIYHRAEAYEERRKAISALGILAACALGGVFIGSPYIFFDWHQVAVDLGGEVERAHLGHIGRGVWGNIAYYLSLVQQSFGWPSFILSIGGALFLFTRPLGRRVILPLLLIQFVVIAGQIQIWERWIAPILPYFCITAALGARLLLGYAMGQPGLARIPRSVLAGSMAVLMLVPSGIAVAMRLQERGNDTRDMAVKWIDSNVPGDSSISVESLLIGLKSGPWKVYFPLGSAGCVDGWAMLRPDTKFEDVDSLRQGDIVDFGHVAAEKISSCRTDYIVVSYYDLYANERQLFPEQWQNYNNILRGARAEAVFKPQANVSGGPVVRIFSLRDNAQLSKAVSSGSPD